jgi:hypothetical protein
MSYRELQYKYIESLVKIKDLKDQNELLFFELEEMRRDIKK